MKHFAWLLILALVVGCSSESDKEKSEAPAAGSTATAGSEIALTPENTTVGFVGSHVVEEGPDPKARHGSFKAFDGVAVVDGDKLISVSVEIETASLDTGMEKLDNHLKQPDFFDVREYPKAVFKSTEVAAGDGGMVTITGDLTLLKETKSVSFPAKATVADGKLELTADFMIDRTEFGMPYSPEKVQKDVAIKISING